ncbi:ImmA/IrrE family metallo-endopeptidase [Anaerococcus tetradius]|uniref:ImmA/IrrE family metallo-endopeptidase n=1 Tax=Anaerococcus tetradius TaxID=33036 RepID=UPI0023EF8C02|nr:ImmA/IrrE family metallo-endopeptidase [Anaerococcus tetradius]
MLKTYSEAYYDEFLRNFGDNAKKIKDIEFDGDFIDVDKIARVCGYNIELENIKESGFSRQDSDGGVEITINENEPEYRRRFTIAHEIGHVILGHINEIEIYRNTESEYRDMVHRATEVSANKFAAELLMPYKLVVYVIRESLKELNYNEDDKLYRNNIEKIIDKSANKMKVSGIAFKYRLDNLGIFNDVFY